jgi:hypothetical protein
VDRDLGEGPGIKAKQAKDLVYKMFVPRQAVIISNVVYCMGLTVNSYYFPKWH